MKMILKYLSNLRLYLNILFMKICPIKKKYIYIYIVSVIKVWESIRRYKWPKQQAVTNAGLAEQKCHACKIKAFFPHKKSLSTHGDATVTFVSCFPLICHCKSK